MKELQLNVRDTKILVELLRDLRILRGNFEDIMKIKTNDYVSVQLTDENFIIDPHGRIRTVCPNILDLSSIKGISAFFKVYKKSIVLSSGFLL